MKRSGFASYASFFGASTMASAATVACFVGGLGAGSLLLGGRADRSPRPLSMYASLEGMIAASAAVTPLLIFLVRAAYLGLGGTRALGVTGGNIVRLLLAAIVFAVPTLLMGGTLPAVARAISADDDVGRRDVALLYGVNTLGAVTGCLLSTFVLFELFGTRLSLWIACLVNALVAVVARAVARSLPAKPPAPASTEEVATGEGSRAPDLAVPMWLTLAAAGILGFVFCLMELVWYRMLGPLLGGTVFTFGLILAIALLGIGVGGLLYGLRPRRLPPTLEGFAWTCLLEAACIAVPFALGDRIAVVAAVLHPLGDLSFALRVTGWAVITGIVVLPASLASGVQFPFLIGLLGGTGRDVGRDVGRVFATNTVGSIAGSIAGGFGLIPALTAPGCWRFVGWALVAVGLAAVAVGARARPFRAIAPALLAGFAMLLLRADGPTAAWRHSPIGAGRVLASDLRSPNEVIAWEHERRRAIEWESDGRESSVALQRSNGLAFMINGKNDGSVRSDAATAVMAGLVGAIFHPHPTRAMVIGLGTGETAGWLGAIDTVTQVDVAELEPAVLEVARRSAPANHAAMANPKVHVELGDARELLLTSRDRYSVIMSEPSNPYRAGVASLFTENYYRAIRDRLDDDGVLLQWLQAYEIDARTVRAVYATLASVFPEIETWELRGNDLLLVASKRPVVHDVARLDARLREEPYRSAAGFAWRAIDAGGFLAHFVAPASLARRVASEETDSVNTDDLNIVEFGFARTLGQESGAFRLEDIRRTARAWGAPPAGVVTGPVDWSRVEELRAIEAIGEANPPTDFAPRSADSAHRWAAMRACSDGTSQAAVAEWRAQPEEPRGPTEEVLLGLALADVEDEGASAIADHLAALEPAEADAVRARLRLRQGRKEEGAALLEVFFERLRVDPWPLHRVIRGAIDEARELGVKDPAFAARMYAALREPLVVRLFDEYRQTAALAIAKRMPGAECVEATSVFAPNVPWTLDFLRTRYECLRPRLGAGDARTREAESDLAEFLSLAPSKFDER